MTLRKLRTSIAEALWQESANLLPKVCKRYGLPEGTTQEAFNSKRMYVLTRLEELTDTQVIDLAKKVLVDYSTADLKEAFEQTQKNQTPALESVSQQIKILGEEHVNEIWLTALSRVETQPEGAITLANTLVDSTCKTILDDFSISYSDKEDIHQIYDKLAKALNLSPSQHQEETFRTILGNCKSIVLSLANIRNKLSEAHGKGKNPPKPLPRHALLAVNLAGSMSAFLIRTYLEKKSLK